MKNFNKYAQYYNLLYRSKNYEKEVDYVDSLIKRYSDRRNKTLLDIGCGTGNHDIWFAKKGYQVVGMDRAGEMIAIARERMPAGGDVEFFKRDVSRFALRRKFDIAVSLFHVMSYLTATEVFMDGLRNIYKHLKKGSLFIFDFWYGPAVMTKRPARKIKNIIDEGVKIKRIAAPAVNFNENTVNVGYKIIVSDKNKGSIKTIKESHKMRYFFLPELYLMLDITGFKVINCLEWMSLKKDVSENSWSGVIIAKRY